MIDELRSWGIEPPAILGDGAYGDIPELRSGLAERERSDVPDVEGGISACRGDVQPVKPQKAEGRGRPLEPLAQ